MITVVANLKGGSGKSTVAFNLALWLQQRGCDVTVFDLDPQCTLGDVAEVRAEEEHEPALSVTRQSHISDDELVSEKGEVMVDVGAANADAMMIALACAQRILIPVPPSQPDVWATQRFLNTVKQSNDQKLNNGSRRIMAFVNRADTHRAVRESDEAEEALATLDDIEVLTQRLHQRTVYRRSLSEGLSVFELSPRSKAALEFEQFAQQVYPEYATQ